MIFAGRPVRFFVIILFSGFFLFPISVLPAIETSAGGGVSLNSVFISSEFGGYSEFESNTGFGIRAFADITYLEISAGLVLFEDCSYASGCVLLKAPFRIGSWYLFPLAGGEYRYDLDDPNASVLLVKGGLGADIPLGGRLFLRPEILAGYVFRSKQDEDRIDEYELYGGATITKISVDVSLYAGYRL